MLAILYACQADEERVCIKANGVCVRVAEPNMSAN